MKMSSMVYFLDLEGEGSTASTNSRTPPPTSDLASKMWWIKGKQFHHSHNRHMDFRPHIVRYRSDWFNSLSAQAVSTQGSSFYRPLYGGGFDFVRFLCGFVVIGQRAFSCI